MSLEAVRLTHTANLSKQPGLAGCRKTAGSVLVSVEPVFWRKLELYFLRLPCAFQGLPDRSGVEGTNRKVLRGKLPLNWKGRGERRGL